MLELHVWGPAFGLASIDAECLATIAYFTQTIQIADYRLIQSSPSAVPTHHLPALHIPSSNTWISGYSAITCHLQSSSPNPQKNNSKQTPLLRSDTTAYTTFLLSHAPPLIALSLYVSSANWSSTVRPAYSRILPFPLPWTEPHAVRAAMSARAAHLGLSSLDTDAEAERAEKEAAADPGWVHVPESIKRTIRESRKRNSVRDSLLPEERSRIRLEGLAGEVLDVVGEVLAGDGWEEDGGEEERTTLELRCLAWGFLALMLVPDVPRPWLREVMRRKYGGLCEFVEGFGRRCGLWGLGKGEGEDGGLRKLPWVKMTAAAGAEAGSLSVASRKVNSLADIMARFAHGLVRDISLVGEEWARWWTHRRVKSVRTSASDIREASHLTSRNKDLLLVAVGGLAFVGVNAGLFYLYKRLLPFGDRVQTWRTPVSLGLSGLGAAGAMFSGLALN